MIARLKNINEILEIESETRLNYMVGQKIKETNLLQYIQPRVKGALMQTLLFLARPWLKRTIAVSERQKRGKVQYFVYAGTGNQMKSLEGCVQALSKRGERFEFMIPEKLISETALKELCTPYRCNVFDFLVSNLVLFKRYVRLYSLLSDMPQSMRDKHFEGFLHPYLYIAFFLRVLGESKPEFVVVSNDHNVDTRCLVAVAHFLGIKTVYMQHASVVPLFPALRFTYAFLDGEKSMRVYEQCEKNSPGDIASYQKPQVFLSGQKKTLTGNESKGDNLVGVAVNMLDPIEGILSLVRRLQISNIPVLLRWHPGQKKIDVERIYAEFGSDSLVQLSDPGKQHVARFLDRIHTMIAGNSSIHLEAALMGVRTIYFEIVPPSTPDYYGYVREKVSTHARSVNELLDMLVNDNVDREDGREEAIRHYSETYGTPWYGKEGELVAETLHRISKGQGVDSIYDRVEKSSVFGNAYGLSYSPKRTAGYIDNNN